MINKIEQEIREIAKENFPANLVENFVSKFHSLLVDEKPLDFFLQISTDQGNELELGFFTKTQIVDVTLSNGKVYFYAYPVISIQLIEIIDSNLKSTLKIQGEKKFDYNVVKPKPISNLERYEISLRKHCANIISLKVGSEGKSNLC